MSKKKSAVGQDWEKWQKVLGVHENVVSLKRWANTEMMDEIAPWAIMLDLGLMSSHPAQAQTVLDGLQAKLALYSQPNTEINFNEFEEIDFTRLAVYRIWRLIQWNLVDNTALKLVTDADDTAKKISQYRLAFEFLSHVRKGMGGQRALSLKKGKDGLRANPHKFAQSLNWTPRNLSAADRPPTKTSQIRVSRQEDPDETLIIEDTKISLSDLKAAVLDWYQPSRTPSQKFEISIFEDLEDYDADTDEPDITTEQAWSEIRNRPTAGQADTVALVSEVVETGEVGAVQTVAPGLNPQGEAFYPRSIDDTRRLLRFGSTCYGDEESRRLNTKKSDATETAGMEVEPQDDQDQEDQDVGPKVLEQSYQVVQSILSSQSTCDDVAHSRASLARMLKVDIKDRTTLVWTLPNRYSEEEPELPAWNGEAHHPFQAVFLEFCLDREATIGSSICVLGSGLGKTHIFLSLIAAGDRYWQLKGQPITKPTLIVAPNTFTPDLFSKARELLGRQYRVCEFKQLGTSDARSPIFNDDRAGKTVVIMSYDQLSNLKINTLQNGQFARIILDEAHNIAHFGTSKRGKMLLKLNAQFRHCFTATVCQTKLENLRGLLEFLERDHFSSLDDRNTVVSSTNDAMSTQAYVAYKNSLDDPRKRKDLVKDIKALPQDWRLTCACPSADSPALLNAADAQHQFCTHWPVGLEKNRDRANSVDRAPMRQAANNDDTDEDSNTTSNQFFSQNPYNLYHELNLNRLQCVSSIAFKYYVEPHIKRLGDENSETIARRRVGIIHDLLAMTRGINSRLLLDDGEETTYGVSASLPALTVETRDLKYMPDELRAYHLCESQCGEPIDQYVIDEDVPVGVAELNELKGGADRRGSANVHNQLMAISSYVGLHKLRFVSTSKWRQRRREGFPQQVDRMKAARGLNPKDQNKVPDTEEEVLRQGLWGAPKYREMLRIVEETLYGDALPERYRNIIIAAQSPRQAETIYKILSFLGIEVLFLDAKLSKEMRSKLSEKFRNSSKHTVLVSFARSSTRGLLSPLTFRSFSLSPSRSLASTGTRAVAPCCLWSRRTVSAWNIRPISVPTGSGPHRLFASFVYASSTRTRLLGKPQSSTERQ